MELFNRLQQGDDKAFRDIFDTYWHSVYAVLLQYTGAEADAQELTQDIFHSLWMRKNSLSLRGDLSHYLHRAAKLKAMQFHRNNARRSRQMAAAAETEPNLPAVFVPLQYKELEADLSQALETLSEPAREVFLLSQHKELTQKEIAERTGISVPMVKYYISNTRHLLKKKLKHHF